MPEYDSAFDALDRTPEEKEQLRLRSAAMRMIRARIKAEGWSQEEAAKRLGMEPTQVSDLMRGKVSSFFADNPEEALAWHRECSNCGIVLTVKIEDVDGEPIVRPAPEESRCGLCKAEYPGPWVKGEYEDSDDGDETDEMRECSECDEGYAHSYVCTRCSSESYQNDDGFMCDQKLHEPCRVCDYGTVHALVAPGYEK